MSANGWGVAKDAPMREQAHVAPARILPVAEGWNPEKFAREQIRSLVRQVFLSSLQPFVKQVVFSAVEQQSDVREICAQVAASLASEADGDVVLVGAGHSAELEERSNNLCTEEVPLREAAIQVQRNLWSMPSNWGSGEKSTSYLCAYLDEIRRDFEYSIIVARSATESNEGAAMARVADGMVLVLAAGRTRRATACRIKKSLDDAQVRLLGIVLSDREFPIPDSIYRKL